MAGDIPPSVARLVAEVDGYIAGMNRAAASTGRLAAAQKDAQGSTARTEAAVNRSAGALAKWGAVGAAAAVGIAVESVKLASKFDAAMERVHTQAGASQKEVDGLKNKVLALAPTVGIGPEKLAEGLYHIESAGFRGKEALDILANAAKLAAIGNANLEDVSQAMIATVASGIPGVHGMADAAALLNTTVGIGDMKMEQLSKAIATGILPSARVAGLTFEDVAASLATITDNATPADEAATRLRMTFSLMAAPSGAAQKALASIGMTGTEMADDMRKPEGLLVALEDLKSHLKASGLTASQQAQVLQRSFGGGKTSGTILTLLTQIDRLHDKYGELGTAASRAAQFQDAWRKTQETTKQKLAELSAGVQVAAIRLGHDLEPAVNTILTGLIDLGKAAGATAHFLKEHEHAVEAVALAYLAFKWESIAGMFASLGARIADATVSLTGFATAENLMKAAAFGGAVAALTVGFDAFSQGQSQAHTKIKQFTKDLDPTDPKTYADAIRKLTAEKAKYNNGSWNPITDVKDFTKLAEYTNKIHKLQREQVAAGAAQRMVTATVDQYAASTGKSVPQVEALAKAAGINLVGSYQQVSAQLNEYQKKTTSANGMTVNETAVMLKAQQQTDANEASMEKLVTSLDKYVSTQLELEGSQDGFIISLAKLKGNIDGASRSLDQNSVSGATNRKALSDLVSGALSSADAAQKAGKSAAEVTKIRDTDITSIEKQAVKLGFSKQQVDALMGSWGLMPANKTTAYNTPGLDTALGKLTTLKLTLDGIHSKDVTMNIDVEKSGGGLGALAGMGYHARGGPIAGPGSGTSDSILARVSNGEYVVNASAAARNRSLLDAINNSAPGFASGGKVAYNTSGPRVWLPAHQGGGSKGTHTIPGHWEYLTAKQVASRQATTGHKAVAQQLQMAEAAERTRAALTSKTSGSLGAMSRAVASLTSHHTLTDVTVAHTRGMQAQLDKQRADAWNAAQFAEAAAKRLEHDPRATAAQRKQAETLARRAFTEYSAVRAVDDRARKLAASTYQALVRQRAVEWHQSASTYGHGGSWGARSHAPVTVQIDGREVFKVVQKQALQSSRRNVNNLLSPA